MAKEPEELEADAYAIPLKESGFDLLWEWNGTHNKCTVLDRGGNRLFDCEMRNDTTRTRQDETEGPCPPGQFILARYLNVHSESMGAYFIPLLDLDEDGPMHKEGRHGIGIHGGGTGLEEPFAPEQGWVRTHGCFRVQNRDLDKLVEILRDTHHSGGHAVLQVTR